MNMMISGVSTKDDKKIAYVSFEDDGRYAEAMIPECTFIKNNGFDEDEINQLADYLKANLTDIKKEAARINPIMAMMKED